MARMTIAQMKQWIDEATYQQLLSRWRFAPIGSKWFQGEVGDWCHLWDNGHTPCGAARIWEDAEHEEETR